MAGSCSMRVRRILGLALGTALAGCYTLEPAGRIAPELGTEVALDVNDSGRVALGGSMGPEIAQIEGHLVQRDSTNYVIAVSVVHLLRGGEQTWSGETTRIKSNYVTSVYQRRLDRGRSIALGVIGAGIGALLITRGILAAGQGDRPQPPDSSGTQQRIPLGGRLTMRVPLNLHGVVR
jgi:hypothetical protein